MFTFVVWAIGLYILAHIAVFAFGLIIEAFDSHWFLGLLSVAGSLIGWIVLLALIF